MKWATKSLIAASGLALCSIASAEKLTLERAIELAQQSDYRSLEKKHLADAAVGLVQEAEGAKGWLFDMTTALAITTDVDGGFFDNNCNNNCDNDNVRDDLYDPDGYTPFVALKAMLIKPLMTFGKIENYKAAAQQLHNVKLEDVTIQQNQTGMDVVKAWYGNQAALGGIALLEEANDRLSAAESIAEDLLDDDDSDISEADIYTLKAGKGLIQKFLAQAKGLQKTAHAGLALLTGQDPNTMKMASKRLRPLPLPSEDLETLQQLALDQRPEMRQLAAGLKARQALVKAKQAEKRPNLFAGLAASVAYAPGRDQLDNPHIVDPFNHYAASPLVGLQWKWQGARTNGQIAQAEAELKALEAKGHFARGGIPFQVQEAWYKVEAGYEAQQALSTASRDARRAMLSAYLDFEAGTGEPAKALEALKTYTLTYADYLLTVNNYNNDVINLRRLTGQPLITQ
jgi:outer membrane protein TolC